MKTKVVSASLAVGFALVLAPDAGLMLTVWSVLVCLWVAVGLRHKRDWKGDAGLA